MSSELLIGRPLEKPKVDRETSRLRVKALKAFEGKPGWDKVKERVERGLEATYYLETDAGNFSASFVPIPGANSFSITRAWAENDGLHRESAYGVAEKPLFGIWKFFDSSQISFERDGTTVFDSQGVVSNADKLLELVKRARPLPKGTNQSISAS